MQRRTLPLWCWLLLIATVAALSWWPRTVHQRCLPGPGCRTDEADALYHARRLERYWNEPGEVAATDPYLNYPEGANIPWPPYYTYFLATVLAPFGPDDGADAATQRAFVEAGVVHVPRVLGVLTSLVTLVAGTLLAGPVAGWLAGSYHALTLASVGYSKVGSGDHHAAVALLASLLLLLTSWWLSYRPPGHRLGRGRWGVAAGGVAGLMLGVWVAGLLYIVEVQLVLALLLFRHVRTVVPGLGAFGLTFHAGAFLAALPAIWESPWRHETPFTMVNLSWFHAVYLWLGGLVFVPLVRQRPGQAWLRFYPWLLTALLAVAAGCFVFVLGEDSPLREAFAWLGRTNPFMAYVDESRPLIGIGSGGLQSFVAWVGWGALLVPVAWLLLVWTAWRREALEWWPWLVALPLLAAQAARQVRFADVMIVPLSVVLGAAVASVWARRSASPKAGTWRVLIPWSVAAVLLVLAQWPAVQHTLRVAREGPAAITRLDRHYETAQRDACEWLAQHSPVPADYAVLADWGMGHRIEWAAQRPSVATNFGLYVGLEGFLTPARFLLTADQEAAEELLEARRARYVMVSPRLPTQLRGLLPALPEQQQDALVMSTGKGIALREAWYDTVGAKLLFGGGRRSTAGGLRPGSCVDFLRLVYVSPTPDPKAPPLVFAAPPPAVFIWESVAGAQVRARGEAGDRFKVEMVIEAAEANYRTTASWSVVMDDEGLGEVRVPYATDGTGAVRVVEASWSVAGRTGILEVSEDQISGGSLVWIRD